MLAKQLFYLTSDQLHAYQCQQGKLSGPDVFAATRAEREAKELNHMTEMGATLSKMTLLIKVKTGEDGKMFGTITSGMIADQLKTQFDIILEKLDRDPDSELAAAFQSGDLPDVYMERGGGELAACRASLWAALQASANELAAAGRHAILGGQDPREVQRVGGAHRRRPGGAHARIAPARPVRLPARQAPARQGTGPLDSRAVGRRDQPPLRLPHPPADPERKRHPCPRGR